MFSHDDLMTMFGGDEARGAGSVTIPQRQGATPLGNSL